MTSRTGRWMSIAGAAALAFPILPVAAPVHAQRWDKSSSCRGLDGRDRARCERDRDRRNGGRWDREESRRDRERERRKDAKTDGIVAGVVGTAIIGGIIAAAASSKKNKNKYGDRRSYCEDRYGNYDERTDSYRASDGRWYRCE